MALTRVIFMPGTRCDYALPRSEPVEQSIKALRLVNEERVAAPLKPVLSVPGRSR
jgi:hypothetical protein